MQELAVLYESVLVDKRGASRFGALSQYGVVGADDSSIIGLNLRLGDFRLGELAFGLNGQNEFVERGLTGFKNPEIAELDALCRRDAKTVRAVVLRHLDQPSLAIFLDDARADYAKALELGLR